MPLSSILNRVVRLHGLNRGISDDAAVRSHVSSLTSSNNSPVTMKLNAQNAAENRHGRRYGYCSQNQFPNKVGNLSCGRESHPPARGLSNESENCTCCPPKVTHPIVPPTPHTSGMSPDAWARFVESVSSAIMVFPTPMFPLSKPAMQRLAGISVTVFVA